MFSAHRKRLHESVCGCGNDAESAELLAGQCGVPPLRRPRFPSGSAAFRHWCGNWVVQEQSGNRGGLFVSRDAALRYVREMRIEIGNARS
jgi:hypothetical protein